MAYFGLAGCGTWNTLDWLRDQAADADRFQSAEAFATALASGLGAETAKLGIASSQAGIGVHFSAYEEIKGNWVPELFFVSNFVDTTYRAHPRGFKASRESYATAMDLPERPPSHGEAVFRLELLARLQTSHYLYFNNGDPRLFNPIASSIFSTLRQLAERGQIQQFSATKHLSLVRRPIELVSGLLQDLAEPGYAVIGGGLHDLAIAPDGTMVSTTGDDNPVARPPSSAVGSTAQAQLPGAGLAYCLSIPPSLAESDS
jgi:hypothetical protein